MNPNIRPADRYLLSQEYGPVDTLREIPGIDSNYVAHSVGKIWSRYTRQWLSASLDPSGYPHVHIKRSNGTKSTISLHRLIAIAWIPNPHNLPEVNHKNGIKTDNRVENLEWCTRRQNFEHAVSTGLRNLRAICEANPAFREASNELQKRKRKLTMEQAQFVRERLAAGDSLSKLGKQFGVDHSIIRQIKEGRSYAR